MYSQAILAAIIAGVAAFLMTPVVINFAHKIGAVDNPNERKVHGKVMPRLGGLAIYLAFVITLIFFNQGVNSVQGILAGSTIIVLLGIIDDTRGLQPKVKLFGQIVAALTAVHFGVKVEFITNPLQDIIFLGKLTVPFTVLWIIGITNAVNLVDGLDGLAAGIAAIASLTMGVVAIVEGQIGAAVLAIILCGSIVGFLKYNFYPAKVFMGDTGSMFLGYVLAVFAIEGLTKSVTVISLIIPVIILGIPIFDTVFAIFRRLLKGNPVFQADKEHLHHRLLHLGLSHKQTVLAIYGVSVCLSGSAVLMSLLTTEQSIIILIALSTLAVLGANRMGVINVQNIIKQLAAERDFNDVGK